MLVFVILSNCPGSSCCGLLPEVPAVRFHSAIRKVPLKIDEETILPVPVGNGAALDLSHIQIVVNKMGQNVIQGSALVGNLQAQTDLVGIFTEDLLVRHNDETGGIAVGIIDPFFRISSP